MITLSALLRASRTPPPVPIATFPGIPLTGTTVRTLVTDAGAQARTQRALQKRFGTSVLMTCMDLSVEAEAFGARVAFSDGEVPTVTGRLLSGAEDVHALSVPPVGTGRTRVYIEAVRNLARGETGMPVIAGMIGPFSLAGRLFGVSEALLATAEEPGLVEELLGKTTQFLIAYCAALKEAGAGGIIIAEPSAGLLSPRGMALHSSPFVRRIVQAHDGEEFDVILHNCAAKAIHLGAVAAAGARIVHFGAPMEITKALETLPPGTLVCGNLDPASVFVHSPPEAVFRMTTELLASTAGHTGFVPSSGCDLPASTPAENLDAFFRAARGFTR